MLYLDKGVLRHKPENPGKWLWMAFALSVWEKEHNCIGKMPIAIHENKDGLLDIVKTRYINAEDEYILIRRFCINNNQR